MPPPERNSGGSALLLGVETNLGALPFPRPLREGGGFDFPSVEQALKGVLSPASTLTTSLWPGSRNSKSPPCRRKRDKEGAALGITLTKGRASRAVVPVTEFSHSDTPNRSNVQISLHGDSALVIFHNRLRKGLIEAMTEPIECRTPLARDLESVYCVRLGEGDRFKVGRTKNSPEDRMRGFSTGSSEKFELYRTIKTAYARELEMYVHQLLDSRRTENGEFFHVTAQELNLAVDDAQAFVDKAQPLIDQAEQLRREKPLNEKLVEPCEQMFQIYQRLRKVRRDRYLIEQEIAFLESTIQVAIGRNAAMREIASWRWTEQCRFDMDRFKKEQDSLYQQYQRISGYRRFSLERLDLTEAA
jgi:hypothetical protein